MHGKKMVIELQAIDRNSIIIYEIKVLGGDEKVSKLMAIKMKPPA